AVPDWIWFVFIFAFGSCIGSFLNVVIYRMPRDKSLVTPPSSCPSCGKHIRCYDNIPLLSWLMLGRRCRNCKAPISARYFLIELLTALIFLGLFVLYFYTDIRKSVQPFNERGWLIYLLHIIMLSAFVAASAIDLEHWIIPLAICWFVTAVGLIVSTVGPYVIDPTLIRAYSLLPVASVGTGSLAVGGAVGLTISMGLLASGLLKRSYETQENTENSHVEQEDNTAKENSGQSKEKVPEQHFNHRLEVFREITFLAPIIFCSIAAYWIIGRAVSLEWQNNFPAQHPVIAGFLGSLWGYFVGCAIVWGVRIFGTFAFGKEAMGLGDVHLMGAAGAVIGPLPVVLAFFIAPFFGLTWAGFQMFFKKIRQIPYGPFLSLGIFVVIILHDLILNRIGFYFCR
ncbi:MAG: prepilin peptidase, partial [Sedimentisphaerales bacterium]|nr:prepilin peptidase [Sedimentisphaerales bacterium]